MIHSNIEQSSEDIEHNHPVTQSNRTVHPGSDTIVTVARSRVQLSELWTMYVHVVCLHGFVGHSIGLANQLQTIYSYPGDPLRSCGEVSMDDCVVLCVR